MRLIGYLALIAAIKEKQTLNTNNAIDVSCSLEGEQDEEDEEKGKKKKW